MIGYLNEIVDRDWRPVSRWALGAWLIFYGWFLIYAFTQGHGYLFIDFANLVVHEAGHLLFGWLGPTLGLGRNHPAMAGAVAAGGIFLCPASDYCFRFLHVFLF